MAHARVAHKEPARFWVSFRPHLIRFLFPWPARIVSDTTSRRKPWRARSSTFVYEQAPLESRAMAFQSVLAFVRASLDRAESFGAALTPSGAASLLDLTE